ncbi:MAG: hypothetical protein ACJAWL_003608 [Motiliproteus sp.]|jgi:hypothetical protein
MSQRLSKRSLSNVLLTTAFTSLISLSAQADWQLDNAQSSLNFISV